MVARARTRRRRSTAKRRRRSPRRAPARPTAWERTREAAGVQLQGHGADAFAVGLVILGVLTVLGLASDLAGPVGRFLADASATLLGRGRLALPAACFGFAALLFVDRSPFRRAAQDIDEEYADEEERPAPAPLRIGLGLLLVLLAAVGLLHLGGGSPAIDASVDELRDAGGLLGAAIAPPLRAGGGAVGAVGLLGGVAGRGALRAPGVPVRR